MKLKAVLDSLEGLDDSLKPLYAENEHGEFVLDLDGVDSHPAVRGLAAALDNKKGALGKLRKQLEAFGDTTAEDLQEKLERLEELEGQQSGGGDDQAAALRQLQEKLEGKHGKEAQKLQTRIDTLTTALQRRVIDGEIDRATDGIFKPELRQAVRALLKQRSPTMVENDDGEFVGVFKSDLNGVPGDHSIGDFVKEWMKTEEAAPFLPASGRTGSGAESGKRRMGGDQKIVTESDLAEGNFDLEALAKGQVEVV